MEKHKVSALFITVILTFVFGTSYGQTDYLGINGPIVFNNGTYLLAWSSSPNENYVKQEYVAEGDKVERFRRMILVEAMVTEQSAESLADAKISELKKLKETNPIVNYEIFTKEGEYLLDFILTEKPDSPEIIERNVYRYKPVTDRNGNNCILLFAVSERAYGNEIDNFLKDLKSTKSDLLNAVASHTLPDITIR